MADRERRSLYPLVALLGTIVAFGLAFWGFALGGVGSLLDHVYWSLQLFVLESGDNFPEPLNWQLEIARLAAPTMTVLSTGLAVVALSRGRIDAWRARRRRGHVVVAGLGHRGAEAALLLSAAGHSMVGIEQDATAGGVRRCRRVGIPVVIGDPRDPVVLESAGTPSAAHLLVLDPDLEMSGQVAVAAVGLTGHRPGPPLVVHVEMDDPALVGLLRALKLSEHHSPGWRVEELDLAGAGARIMLDAVEPWEEGSARAEVLVVGDSALAAAVGCEIRRRWRAVGRSLPDLAVVRVSSLSAEHGLGAPDAVYVCVEDETEALSTALSLLRELPGVPVVVRVEHAAQFGALLQRDSSDLNVVATDRQVLTPEVLLDTTVERIARALHASYRRHADPADVSAVQWPDLPESLRASNRSQAEHVADKIRATHRVLVPEDGEPADAFTEDEVQQLGRFEHDRWTAERLAAGWTPGPRDPHARTSPYLVPWEELDEDVREIDRQFVRALPEVLMDAGLVLRRVQHAAPGTAMERAPRRAS